MIGVRPDGEILEPHWELVKPLSGLPHWAEARTMSLAAAGPVTGLPVHTASPAERVTRCRPRPGGSD